MHNHLVTNIHTSLAGLGAAHEVGRRVGPNTTVATNLVGQSKAKAKANGSSKVWVRQYKPIFGRDDTQEFGTSTIATRANESTYGLVLRHIKSRNRSTNLLLRQKALENGTIDCSAPQALHLEKDLIILRVLSPKGIKRVWNLGRLQYPGTIAFQKGNRNLRNAERHSNNTQAAKLLTEWSMVSSRLSNQLSTQRGKTRQRSSTASQIRHG
jgi:hypothetical protein